MNRTALTRILTGAFVAAMLLLVVGRSRGWTFSFKNVLQAKSPTQTPEDAIYRMLDASRAGNASAYTACYTGHMLEQLRQAAAEQGDGAFSQYLKTSNAAIQGIALSPPEAIANGEVKLRVEYVYKDRNEVQYVYLRNPGSGWLIEKVDGAERIKTLVPFGSAVTD